MPAPLKVGVGALGSRLLGPVRADSLDRAAVEGADPSHSLFLAGRAARLTSMRHRLRLAEGVERLAASGSSRCRSVVGGNAAALSANRDRLAELAALLRDGTPVYAAGVARLRLLLTDPCSPAHAGDAAALTAALDVARRAMAGHAQRDVAAGRRARSSRWAGRAGASYRMPDCAWVHGRREGS
ncbi:MAG TPA: hypothetical protein VMI13_11300 [Solirubrobacteraceae bacterium]|nr:hypothetical protein [Solirubrobacteraceae bacterium]